MEIKCFCTKILFNTHFCNSHNREGLKKKIEELKNVVREKDERMGLLEFR